MCKLYGGQRVGEVSHVGGLQEVIVCVAPLCDHYYSHFCEKNRFLNCDIDCCWLFVEMELSFLGFFSIKSK